jgi:hypothetical protein
MRGSGGQRTILRHASYLVASGISTDLLVVPFMGLASNPSEDAALFEDYFGYSDIKVVTQSLLGNEYDLVIASTWWTVYKAAEFGKPIVYFVQDFEHLFQPAGTIGVKAQATYSLGLDTITIGKFLASQISNKNNRVRSTPFGVDPSIYFNPRNLAPREGMVILYQPNKPRRCPEFIEELIAFYSEKHPEVSISVFGNESKHIENVENLGILSPDELGELYRSHKVGVSLSATNPSRVSFEMAASGLQVIELDLACTSFDLMQTNVTRAFPNVKIFEATIQSAIESEKISNPSPSTSIDNELMSFKNHLLEFANDPRLIKIPTL